MSNTALFYVAGVPFFTLRDSIIPQRAGGISVSPAANGRSVGQRSDVKIVAINASIYPTVAGDATIIRTLLRTGGMQPMILPDGTRLPVAPQEGGHTMQGNYTQQSDSYAGAWTTVPEACLVDMPWRGAFPGDLSYCRYTGGPPLTTSSGWTLVSNSGWRATGTGTYGGRWIKETVRDPEVRPQPILTADILVPVGVDMAIGLGDPAIAVSTAALPTGSLGVRITSTALQIVAPGVTTSVARANTATRYRVVIIARPMLARITVSVGNDRVLLKNAIPFTLPSLPLGPFLNIKSGQVTWLGWNVLAQ